MGGGSPKALSWIRGGGTMSNICEFEAEDRVYQVVNE